MILQHCLENGKITQEDFSRASAKLIGFEYAFTSLNPNALVSAAHIAEWDVRQWPLKQAIDQFASDSVDLVERDALDPIFADMGIKEKGLLFHSFRRFRESVAEKRNARHSHQLLDGAFGRRDEHSIWQAIN